TTHFEDELKNFTTDQEKKQKAEKLIAEFGDVETLAVLLRRAKKRCRPLWRTAIARTYQAIGVSILCLILYLVWFFSGKPIVTIDYVAELNRMARPVADESLNAAPFYKEAAIRYEKLSEDNKVNFVLLSKKPNEVTPEQKQLIEKWLTDNKETIGLVITGSQKPYNWFEYNNKNETDGMIGVLLPNLAEFRRLAYSLRWRAYLCAEKGRYEEAFNDIKSCYRFGQHFRGDKTLVEQLVGIAIEAMAVQAIRDIISQYQIDPAALATLQKDLEQITTDENFKVSLTTEKLFILDEVQRCFTADRIGGGHLYLQRVASFIAGGKPEPFNEKFWPILLRALFTHPNKEQTLEAGNKFYDYAQEMTTQTPAKIRTEHPDLNEEFKRITKGNLLLELLAPAFQRIIEISFRCKTDVEATLTIIAIWRYRQKKGAYPENLKELVTSGYIQELPIDSFSDKPLVYKKSGDDFILYSVGPNCVDDGGQSGKDDKGRPKLWADNGDAVLWPVLKSDTKK
ncbi:MAG: hypothetical protein MUP16_02895, partial [Sedimentisphaerales bacterium]|nr:hypothetical protein [Sedimentisphaerales bacterium]